MTTVTWLLIGLLIGVAAGAFRAIFYFTRVVPFLKQQGHEIDQTSACFNMLRHLKTYYTIRGSQASRIKILLAVCNLLFVLAWLILLGIIVISATQIDEINKNIRQE